MRPSSTRVLLAVRSPSRGGFTLLARVLLIRLSMGSLPYARQVLELGASIIWDRNFYMAEAAKRMGLASKTPSEGDENGFAIYDGSRFVFNQVSCLGKKDPPMSGPSHPPPSDERALPYDPIPLILNSSLDTVLFLALSRQPSCTVRAIAPAMGTTRHAGGETYMA